MTSQRSSSTLALLAAAVAAIVIGLPLTILLLLGDSPSCGESSAAPDPSSAAKQGIPANYLTLYQAAGAEYGLPWTLMAAIGSIETDHGRSTAAGVRSGVNSFGCCAGPMQFSIVGRGGGTWGAYGVDGDNDGQKTVYNPADAIPGAAKYLKASGAPADLHAAIFAYNRAEWYVQDVLAKMRLYGGASPSSLIAPDNTAASVNCDDLGGLTATGDQSNQFTLAPGANAPGRPLTAAFTAFVERMASFYQGRLVLTTGTNHDRLTTGGNVSDHFSGNGGDFGMVLNGGTNSGPVGTSIAAAAFAAAGLPAGEAVKRARAGGFQTVYTSNYRIQIIWLAEGHYDHVHVGIGPA